MASDLFWPEICGDLVKISRGEQRENMSFFFFNFEQWKLIMRVKFGKIKHCANDKCDDATQPPHNFLSDFVTFMSTFVFGLFVQKYCRIII